MEPLCSIQFNNTFIPSTSRKVHSDYTARDLCDFISKGNFKKIEEIIDSNPKLLLEKTDWFYLDLKPVLGTPLQALFNGKNPTSKEALKLAIKIIELEPQVDINSIPGEKFYLKNILETTLSFPKCEERTQLLYYLIFLEVDIRFNEYTKEETKLQYISEINTIKQNIKSSFLRALDFLKICPYLNVVLPQEINYQIALDILFVKCPYLAKLSAATLIQKMREYTAESQRTL